MLRRAFVILFCLCALGVRAYAGQGRGRSYWEKLENKWGVLWAYESDKAQREKNLSELINDFQEEIAKAEKEGNLIRQTTFCLWMTRVYLNDVDDYAKAIEYGEKTLELLDKGDKTDPSQEPEESFYPWLLRESRSKEWSKANWYKDIRYDITTALYGAAGYNKKYNEVAQLAGWELKRAQEKQDRKRSIELALQLNGIHLNDLRNYSKAIEYGELALSLLNEGIKSGPENDPDERFYVELKEASYLHEDIPLPDLAKKVKKDWYRDKKLLLLYPLSQAYKFVGDNKKAELCQDESSKIQPSEEENWESVKESYRKSIKDCQKGIEKWEKDRARYIRDYADGAKAVDQGQAILRQRIKETEEEIIELDRKLARKKAGEKDAYGKMQDAAVKGDLNAMALSLKDIEVTSRNYETRDVEKHGPAADEYINTRIYSQMAGSAFNYGLYPEAYDYAVRALASQEKYLAQFKEYLDQKALGMSEQWREGYKKSSLEAAESGFLYEYMWLIAGSCLRHLGRNSEAIGLLEKAYNYHGDEEHHWHPESMDGMGGLPIRIEVLQELALAYRDAGMNQKGIDAFKELIDYFEGVRARITQSTQKIGYLSRYTQAYEQIIALLITEKDFNQTLSYVERARSRAFVDMLGEKALKPKNKEATALNEKRDSLKTQYAALLKETAGQDASGRERSIKIIQKEMDDITQDLANKDAEFSSLITVRTLSTDEIRSLLDNESVLLEYYVTGESLFICVVTKDNLAVKKINIPRWILARKVAEFRSAVSNPSGRGSLKAASGVSQVRCEITPKKFKNGDEYTTSVYVKNNSGLFLSLDEFTFKADGRDYKQDISEKEIPAQEEKVIYKQTGKWELIPLTEQVILATDQGVLKSNTLNIKVDSPDVVTIEDKGYAKETNLALEEARQYDALSLYDILIKPVLPYLVKKCLIIVPHGILHYIPFSALTNNGRFLIEDYALAYLPSATVYKFCKEKKRKLGNKVLAIGDPDLKDPRFDIPFTVTEVNSIASFFPDSKVLIKSQATKSAFKSLAASYDILHLACHGIFDANKPMDSSLLLTPSIMDDGRLTTSEIFDLEFNAGLVTLSACSSGMSRIRAGDETIGLPRAFIYAGIPSIVASLWNVNDESTALLMKKFYSNLKTLSKAEALQQAQLSLLKDKKYASPYFWAAFYLIGEET